MMTNNRLHDEIIEHVNFVTFGDISSTKFVVTNFWSDEFLENIRYL